MTPRERVRAAAAHREPDAVPVDLGGTPSSGISVIAYNRLKKHLDMTGGSTRVYDVVQQLAQPEEEIIDRFGISVLDIGRSFNREASAWYDITAGDGSIARYPVWFRPRLEPDGSWNVFHSDGSRIAKMPSGATFFDQTVFPYLDGYPSNYRNLPEAMDKVLWSALVHSPWDNAGMPDFWETLRSRALTMREKTDKALIIVAGCNLFEWGTFLRRMDNFLMDLYTDQENVEKLLDALMEIHIQTLGKVCEAVGDAADVLRFGDDLGMDSGPFMSPDIYRKLFKPRHRVLCDFVKKNSSMHTFLHSCGSISELLPDLIEAGYDIINPVQTNAKGMEAEYLKREFGKDITFWGGGADTRHVLNSASPAGVKDHVKRRLEVFGKGGGFVFTAIHNIMPDVPPENIVAMFDAIREFNGG